MKVLEKEREDTFKKMHEDTKRLVSHSPLYKKMEN